MSSDFSAIQAAYQEFPSLFASVVICTVSADGVPNASYAPCIVDTDKKIYTYVSGLSTHTQNLQTNPQASLLFIEDESKTQQIFARRRLTYDCTASLFTRDTPKWVEIDLKFGEKFGNIIQIFRDLPDFRIYQFTPIGGRFVVGFGAAYDVDKNDLNQLIHVKG
ncbi:HugZ family pyridoxamine 5'-phosphate oxidase [Calothrix sp. NIES-3974]|uniref:HugZ family pyridoxamine 5'-phosphate oxidase n=1 Tax=Calothrix sp. NIES-3974 TaxID=2005462 RepID=UPI000B5F153E|nr:pyridoxamine 5'-phosphate oxidase family protein [Calothrix sp. NIES-3974]BAZ05491.1 pyridoxamine 5'-phosphate oxidase-related FMN-binding protein [Calothrix sp. NIES-3974]